MNTTTPTKKRKTRKPSERQQRLTLSKIEALRQLMVTEIVDENKTDGLDPVLKSAFHSMERALIKEKIFTLIDQL